ncbi:hypothetical protein JCM10212_004767 [Sporobolomyces blumeae]
MMRLIAVERDMGNGTFSISQTVVRADAGYEAVLEELETVHAETQGSCRLWLRLPEGEVRLGRTSWPFVGVDQVVVARFGTGQVPPRPRFDAIRHQNLETALMSIFLAGAAAAQNASGDMTDDNKSLRTVPIDAVQCPTPAQSRRQSREGSIPPPSHPAKRVGICQGVPVDETVDSDVEMDLSPVEVEPVATRAMARAASPPMTPPTYNFPSPRLDLAAFDLRKLRPSSRSPPPPPSRRASPSTTSPREVPISSISRSASSETVNVPVESGRSPLASTFDRNLTTDVGDLKVAAKTLTRTETTMNISTRYVHENDSHRPPSPARPFSNPPSSFATPSASPTTARGPSLPKPLPVTVARSTTAAMASTPSIAAVPPLRHRATTSCFKTRVARSPERWS